MKDSIDLSCVPFDEPCAQVGDPDYQQNSVKECRAYIGQLRRMFGPEPEGCKLKMKSNPHDFGSYLSVVCMFEADNDTHLEYAFKLDADGPAHWDELARAELGLVS